MSTRLQLFLVIIVAAILTLPWIGDKPFYTRGEPREAIVAQDMLLTGNWILPSGYGVDVPSKPPLLHWFMAGFSKVGGGMSEFTCRLPSGLASILFAGAFFLFLRKRSTDNYAAIATLLLLTTSEWSRAALASRVDMILAAFTAAGLLAIYNWSEKEYRGFPTLAVVVLAAATLAKGPVSIVIPGAILFFHGLLKKVPVIRIVIAGTKLFVPVACIAALWYLAAYLQAGEKFYHMVMEENFNRFAGTMEETPHKHSIAFHPLMLFVGLLPWSLIALPSFVTLRKRVFEWWRGRSDFDRYSAIVAVVFLLFYSIPASKRSVYLLPAYPFLCVLLAGFFSSTFATKIKSAGCTFGVLGFFYILCMFVLLSPDALIRSALSLLSKPDDAEYFVSALRGGFFTSTIWDLVVMAIPFIALVVYFSNKLLPRVDHTTKSLCVVGAFICALNGAPARWIAESVSSKPFSDVVAKNVPAESQLHSFGTEFYGISYYTARRIFSAVFPLQGGAYILLNESDLPELQVKLSAGQSIKEITRSTSGITKPDNIVLLGQIVEAQ